MKWIINYSFTFSRSISNSILCGLLIILSATYCLADDNADKESVSMCAMIPIDAISDVYQSMSAKTSEDNSYLLVTSARLAIDGHAYILNGALLKLDSLTIYSMENGNPTDEVIYLSKSNRGVGGVFYRDIAKDGSPDVSAKYISDIGHVSHFNVTVSPECLNHFPKSVLSKVSAE